MVCFWIGCNHVSHGLKKIKPGKRLALELVSLVLLLITWCFTIPGIAIYTNTGIQDFMNKLSKDDGSGINLGALIEVLGKVANAMANMLGEAPVHTEEDKKMTAQLDEYDKAGLFKGSNLEGTSSGLTVVKAFGHDVFVAACTTYTIITFFLLILNLFYRKEYLKPGQKPLPRNSEWVDRPKTDKCCSICSPLNALRMFHNSQHWYGFFIFIVCALLQVELYFTIPLILLCFTQIIISYLYAEDIMLCALPLCCVSLYFIRRYPQEEFGGMEHKMEPLTV